MVLGIKKKYIYIEYQEEKLREIVVGKRGERYRMAGIKKKRIQRREHRKK